MRIIRELTYIGPRDALLHGWNRRAVTHTRDFGKSGTITERVKYYDEYDDATEPPPPTDDDLAQMTCVELEA